MGTLGKSNNDKMSFRFDDGTAKTYPAFKEAMIKWADEEGFPWMIEGGNAIFAIFQAANAKAAKGTRNSSWTGTPRYRWTSRLMTRKRSRQILKRRTY